jgi:hypothetical protein
MGGFSEAWGNFSSRLETDWESSGFEAASFPIRSAAKVPAGYPWQVASQQILLPSHRLARLSRSIRSSSICFRVEFSQSLAGLDSLLLPFGTAGVSRGSQFGVQACQHRQTGPAEG